MTHRKWFNPIQRLFMNILLYNLKIRKQIEKNDNPTISHKPQ